MKPSEEAYIDRQNAAAIERARLIQLGRDEIERQGLGWVVLPDWALEAHGRLVTERDTNA